MAVQLAVAAIAAAVAFAGCGGDDGGSSDGGQQANTQQTEEGGGQAGDGGECESAEPETRDVSLSKPKFRLDPDKTYVATVETSCGAFKIKLDPKEAPITGGSFVTLARKGFYDGLGFHRIVPGFVIQGGDPRGDGTGGPGYSVRERPPRDTVYSEGVVAMAKTGAEPAGTSGSQFFVVTAGDSALEPDYAVLGEVTEGLGTVRRIGAIPVTNEKPTRPVVIKTVKIGAR